MSLKNRVLEDIKTAMRAQDKLRLATLRMASAGIKQQEVDTRVELDDAAVLAILEKMIRQRKEAAQQFRDGGRTDLQEKEEAEIEILRPYLPEPLSPQALDQLIKQAITAVGAGGPKDMGKVIAHLRPLVQGRAEMSEISGKVKALLGP